MSDLLQHRLKERMKELRALHDTALLLQDNSQEPESLFRQVVDSLPAAWQLPESHTRRISAGRAGRSPLTVRR
jgi:hypothetical protein